MWLVTQEITQLKISQSLKKVVKGKRGYFKSKSIDPVCSVATGSRAGKRVHRDEDRERVWERDERWKNRARIF